MSFRSRSQYLDKLDSSKVAEGSSKRDVLAPSSYLRTGSGISCLYPTKTMPTKTSASIGTDYSTGMLRKTLSGASSTGSPMSATGHRPPSKAQRTSIGGSSAAEYLYETRCRVASPGRTSSRSLSAARGSSFAAERPASIRSCAAPLHSFQSLPTRVTRSSAAAAAYPLTQARPTPNPTSSRLTPTYPSSQSSRPQGIRSSAAQSSNRLDKLYAAYMDKPAGKPSASRSISVGRRSSSDIAASLHRPLDRSAGSGIGSLGAPPQPVQTAGYAMSASVGRGAVEPTLPGSSAHVRDTLRTTAYQPQQIQQDGTQAAFESSSRLAHTHSVSSNSVSGRSSLVGRSSSRSFDDEDFTTKAQARANGSIPSSSESVSEHSSRAPAVSRQSSTSSSNNYMTTYQTAYSTPSSSLRKLSFKHTAHGDRITASSQSDLIQAVPSGSGRFSVTGVQDVQLPAGSRASGKALITAALSKMGLTPVRYSKGFVGLSNLGNTCFANSIMQCLVSIPELVSFFLTAGVDGGQGKPSGPISGAFGSLVQQLWASSSSAVDPYMFMKACGSHDKQWRDGRQHDAQEYLRSILEAMQTELNRIQGRPLYKELKGEGTVAEQADEAWEYAHSRSSSIIQDIFAGQLQSTLQCPACGALSHTFDEFMDLSLPLPQRSGLIRSPTCTVQECLDAFTETETLEEDEGYNCQACKRKGVCATKKLTLYRCPPVLVLHLKRFSSSNGTLAIFSRSSAMSKDTTQVEVVADKLDLSPYCSTAVKKQVQKPVYSLAAVTNHSGSMAGGHYTAQCKSALDDRWYDCNDSSVREDAGVEGPSSSAYVLFYRRQD